MCTWAGVSASGFYHWRSRPLSATAKRRAQLRTVIPQVFSDSQETYGYRRVHAALQRLNMQAGAEQVRALMRELGLVSCQPRPWRAAAIADDAAPATPDRIPRTRLLLERTAAHPAAAVLRSPCSSVALTGFRLGDFWATATHSTQRSTVTLCAGPQEVGQSPEKPTQPTQRVARSTRVPIAELWFLPMMRSPAQRPGMAWSSVVGSRVGGRCPGRAARRRSSGLATLS